VTDLEREPKWGLGDCIVGIFAGFAISFFVQIMAIIGWSGTSFFTTGIKNVSNGEKLFVTIVGLVGLWIGLAGAVLLASRNKSSIEKPTFEKPALSQGLRTNFGFAFKWSDLPLGLAVGVGCQIVLVPLLYLPFIYTNKHLSSELAKPAKALVGSYHGFDLLLIALFVAVGAPIVEELFFRGLLFRSLLKTLLPKLGGAWGLVMSVLFSSLIFALAHYEALQFGGLAATGAVFAVVAYKTGRIGPTIIAHATFNGLAVVALALKI
jgi:membrane protease YdiL (CAAX protease family)